ncbi:MAG: hypothetical protein QNJ40_00770 [Xanthomonadales bacterium]|nr:hypothetical protein [Xanthomonadales bacterium]
MNTGLFRLVPLLAALGVTQAMAGDVFFVAPGGSDQTGNGSPGNPWASITHAVDNATEGATILVRPGTYNGRQRLRREFESTVTVMSEVPYAARLRHNGGAPLIAYYARNITIEGFDIAHAPDNTGGLVIQVQDLLGAVSGSAGGTDPVVSGITFRNNIIHDSTNNDLLKINNGAEDVLVEGNLFFNQQGSDEHMDVNSVIGVTIQDNIFLNTVDTGTSSFVVVKDSNGNDDSVLGASDIIVRRNVFLNWNGNAGQSFLRFGEDGTANFEAFDLLVENNLMIGNSGDLMRTPFTVQGSRDLVFRNNTLVGDMPARSFAGRLLAGGTGGNENLRFVNNIYSDPTGTMGSEAFSGVDLFDAPAGETASFLLDNNMYWNGGNPIPNDSGQAVMFGDDANAIVADPQLGNQAGLVVPVWNGSTFADGSSSIRQAFESLVNQYGVPGSNTQAVDTADPTEAAFEDILGRERGPLPDLGAYEIDPIDDTVFSDSFE